MNYEMALSEDITIEILIHLPVKSLMRFRSVSKYWSALIKHPTFITAHLKRDCKTERVLILHKHPQYENHVLTLHSLDSPNLLVSPSISIPLLQNSLKKHFYDFFGTCNGLVCLAIFDFDFDTSLTSFAVILCNPALREFKLLDPTPFLYAEHCHIIGWGFRFDANTNAYKVLQLWDVANMNKDEHLHTRTDLYNSSTNSWRLIHAVMPNTPNYDALSSFFFNGACHWQAESDSILSFDLSTEVFQEFDSPILGVKSFSNLLVFNQCLSLLHCTHCSDGETQVMNLWVMMEYGVKESWTKQMVIMLGILHTPLLFLKNEWLLVEDENGQLGFVALPSNEIKRFDFYGARENYMQALIFSESLVSIR